MERAVIAVRLLEYQILPVVNPHLWSWLIFIFDSLPAW